MGVGLYTSRLVLDALGVVDYGIYSLVGGFVVMIGFIKGAMSTATQRYLSFDIGKGDNEHLRKTFSASLTIHIGIALIVLLMSETLGLWYINNIMSFPPERKFAVNVVFQFSMLTFLIGIIQVPYNALIVAREKMKVFAYVSILEVCLKLFIVILLLYYGSDKLITYAILTFTVSVFIRIIYQVYCRRNFSESKFKFEYDREYYRELISYSGWNLFGNIALVSKNQGVNLVLNLFYGTAVNAAYAIAMQVQGVLSMFVSNFQTAVNPQIIINHAKNNLKQSHNLIIQSSKLSFFMLLIVIFPILWNTDYVLNLWLGTLPPLSIVFVQLCLINLLIDSVSGPLMTGIQATGNIKEYQIVVGTLQILNLPLSYIFLKLNFSASIVFVISIIIAIIAMNLRLYYLRKTSGFNILNFYRLVVFRISYVLLFICLILYFLRKTKYSEAYDFLEFLIQSAVVFIIVIVSTIIFGLTREEMFFVKKLIKKNKN